MPPNVPVRARDAFGIREQSALRGVAVSPTQQSYGT